jgi:hypothetical protein
VKVAAICPNCKIQLPEVRLFSYYSSALVRDKSLAQPEKRSKLDAIVTKESEARSALLEQAREKARVEEERIARERAQKEKEMRERQAVILKEAREKRQEFIERNRKKFLVGAVVTSVLASVATGSAILLKPDQPTAKISAPDIKLQPCIALGDAAKKINSLLNLTLEKNLDGNLSITDIYLLGQSASQIQVSLIGSTNGQTSGFPGIEGAIIGLGNNLGAYSQVLEGLRSEEEILRKATNPLHKLNIAGQKACISAGFGGQFKTASGWEN